MSSMTDPSEAIRLIQRVKKEYDDTVGKLNRYSQYQSTLEV